MRISKQARREAKQLFRTCQVDGLLDEARVRRAVREVIARKPRRSMAILSHFERLVRFDLAQRAATVESATGLTPEAKSRVETNLVKRYGQGLELSFRESGALIGGLRIRVGCDVFDGSVAGRLAALEDSF